MARATAEAADLPEDIEAGAIGAGFAILRNFRG
jgi:hypothetical protein